MAPSDRGPHWGNKVHHHNPWSFTCAGVPGAGACYVVVQLPDTQVLTAHPAQTLNRLCRCTWPRCLLPCRSAAAWPCKQRRPAAAARHATPHHNLHCNRLHAGVPGASACDRVEAQPPAALPGPAAVARGAAARAPRACLLLGMRLAVLTDVPSRARHTRVCGAGCAAAQGPTLPYPTPSLCAQSAVFAKTGSYLHHTGFCWAWRRGCVNRSRRPVSGFTRVELLACHLTSWLCWCASPCVSLEKSPAA